MEFYSIIWSILSPPPPWEMGIAWTDGESWIKTLGLLNWHRMSSDSHPYGKSVHA